MVMVQVSDGVLLLLPRDQCKELSRYGDGLTSSKLRCSEIMAMVVDGVRVFEV